MEFISLYATLIAISSALCGGEKALQELAREMPTTQSGTKQYMDNGTLFVGQSGLAVDGRLDTGCSLTLKALTSWWMVDIGQVFFIKHVVITPRPHGNYVLNFTIEVSKVADNSTGKMVNPEMCHEREVRLDPGIENLIPCNRPVMGRYLKVTKYRPTPKSLGLCEVGVRGSTTERFFTLEARRGKRSLNLLLHTIRVSSHVICSSFCQQREDCTSFNIADKEGACELIVDPVEDVNNNEITAAGWTHYVFLQH